ncbi:CBS domain-containing protein [Stetteria hydrogenophila]
MAGCGISCLKASSVMGSDVPAVDKGVSLGHVLRLMDKAKVDRAVLVNNGVVRGILTLRDVMSKLALERTRTSVPSALHASSFASEPAVTVGPEDTLARVAGLMVEGGFTSVPVVSGDGKLLGVIARKQLAKVASESPALSDVSVRDYMRTPPVSVNLQTRILHVRQLLLEYDLSVVPVIEEGRFVGVIGVDEVTRMILEYYEIETKTRLPLERAVVADAVKLRPPRLTPESRMAEAAYRILESGYRAAVVLDKERVVGIVTGLELAKAIASQA